ncbi:glycosyltransferase family 2 protein [Niastella caeni]|uniref:Glycosyltransferase family 2 protein n=1 Tax=Niastella caeni TaxID=2569763 RepID=A0A4S8I1R8_9BACT|nr:glycosyltransferase family 2 protein [Niastella caeni]THU41950.1 glycosyltransferase family 2 protein [Niastella caeni]
MLMLLTVIIVNYNVKYFLEQCLCSVRKAIGEMTVATGERNVEVYVIDNNSTDGSIEYLQNRFPFVQFIKNSVNQGFSKANNQGIQKAKGKYILFLNPDTILPEDAFTKCIAFMESTADAGALGVPMIDGTGQYLKESKRGFPSLWVSFCKMSGLTRWFPTSKLFARYYLGHLNNQETNKVDILSGAFMMVQKAVLDKTGGFDEQFFMYGEDIDLSYRLQQSGHQNYYFSDCTIIHFKGESTRKDSKYVRLFYKAMVQFVQKHFHGELAWLYTGLLEAVIWLRAAITVVSREHGERTIKYEGTPAFYLAGDDKSGNEVRSVLTTFPNYSIIAIPEDAKEWIFCEGSSYSFKQIIEQLKTCPDWLKPFIHASGTYTIVGSHSKDQRGYAIVME